MATGRGAVSRSQVTGEGFLNGDGFFSASLVLDRAL